MKKILLFALALLATVTGKADNEMLYGIYQGSGTLKTVGTEKAETYDVAIHLNEDYLVGMEIRGIRVPVNTAATKATDFSAWLSTSLNLDGGKNAPDIASVSFTPDGRWAEVDFETPYVVTENGVYAGYSFTVNEVDVSNTSDQNRKPLSTITAKDDVQGYIHTSRTFRKWKPIAEGSLAGNAVALVVRLSGDRMKGRAAAFLTPDELDAYATVGKQATVNLTLVNHGVEDIKDIDYEIEIDGKATPIHKAVALKGGYYGHQTALKATVPAVTTRGTRNVVFRITQVNGQPNEDDEAEAALAIGFLDGTPKRKPLMEEYTGTWCGWCPRGMAAMDALTEQLGDDFIGVAFHNGDEMTITNNYPNAVQSFPHGFLDRVVELDDPFYGNGGGSLGVKKDWQNRLKAVIAPATLALKAEWTDDAATAIDVTSTTTFVRSFHSSPYRLAYILVADSLTGTGRSWSQANYLSGKSEYMNDPYLSRFYALGGTIINFTFNDVAIQLSCPASTSLPESLPAQVDEEQPYEHHYTFDISKNDLVQDKQQLRVVVLLINSLTGEVLNAEKAAVPQPTGIRAAGISTQDADVRYFDLSGRPVQTPRRGIYVRTATKADGTRHHQTIVRH